MASLRPATMLQSNKLSHLLPTTSAKAIEIAGAPAVFHPHVAADGPAQLLQALQKRRVAALRIRVVRGPNSRAVIKFDARTKRPA